MYATEIKDSVLKLILKDCQIDVEDDHVHIGYDVEGIYLYAYRYYDDSEKEMALMMDGEHISLTENQIDMIYGAMGKLSAHYEKGTFNYGDYCNVEAIMNNNGSYPWDNN